MKTTEMTLDLWLTLDAKKRKGYAARRSAERRAAKKAGLPIPPTMAEQLKTDQPQTETAGKPAPAKAKRVIVDNDLIPPKPSKRKPTAKKPTSKKK